MDYGPEAARRFGMARRVGDLPCGVPGAVSGEAWDRTLQVWVRFQLEITEGRVRTARFRAFGCPHTVAAADWTAEWLEGRDVESARVFAVQAVQAELGVPIEKLGKLLKIEDALADCWRDLEPHGTAPAEQGN